MTDEKTTDVVIPESKSGGAVMPAFMQGQDVGEDNFDQDDVVLPRIKLLQGISPEVEQFDEAKSGQFWHTGLDLPLGTEIEFVPADRRKKYLLSAPLADGQGILARSDDAKTWDRLGKWEVKLKNIKKPAVWEITTTDVEKSGVTKWGSSNPDDEDSPPAATLFYDYLVFLPAFPELGMAVISLARSAIRPVKKQLNSKIQMHKDSGRPMQGCVYVATSVEEQGPEGPFKNWSFRSGGFVQDEAIFTRCMEHRGALANFKIQDEDGDVKESDGGDGGEMDGKKEEF